MGVVAFAEEMRDAGVRLLQYRNKTGSPREILDDAVAIGEVFHGTGCRLVLNDRPDLALLAGWSGVHVGQEDLPPAAVRHVFGEQACWVGISTHTEEQVRAAEQEQPDYIAVGPVFTTGSKADAEPVIGLAGVRRARELTPRPLVAIGGITRANARRVIEAGADSVAVIGALLAIGEHPGKIAAEFLELLR